MNGIIQLCMKGVEDIILTGNPEITFFKCIYRRYVNFSQDEIIQTVEGLQEFGSQTYAKILRGGDLLSKLFLTIKTPEICMKYKLTPTQQINEYLKNVGVTPQNDQTAIQAINQAIEDAINAKAEYQLILDTINSPGNKNKSVFTLLELVNLLIPIMTDINDQNYLSLAQYLLQSDFYSQEITNQFIVSCSDSSVTEIPIDNTSSKLVFLPEFLDIFHDTIYSILNDGSTTTACGNGFELRVLEQLETLQFTDCELDTMTKLQKLLSLLKIKPEDKNTDVYNYIIYLDSKYNSLNFNDYYTAIRNQTWRCLFNVYFNIVNILRSLAEDIGDNILFKGTNTKIIGQILPIPSKSYYRYSAQAFSDVLSDYSYFSPPLLTVWDFSSQVADLITQEKTNLITQNTYIFGIYDEKYDLSVIFGPNGFTTGIPNNRFYHFQTLYTNYAVPAGYILPPVPNDIFLMNGILLNYNKMIENFLLNCYPDPLDPAIVTTYDTVRNTLVPYVFNAAYIPDLLNDNSTIFTTINSVVYTSIDNVIYIFDKNPIYTIEWIKTQWASFLSIMQQLFDEGMITDPKCLRLANCILKSPPECDDPTRANPVDPQILPTPICTTISSMVMPDITTPAIVVAPPPIFPNNCFTTNKCFDPVQSAYFPPDFPPDTPPDPYIFTNTTFLNSCLQPDLLIWDGLQTDLTNAYNNFYKLKILNLTQLLKISGCTTNSIFSDVLNNLIFAINSVYPNLIDPTNIQYNLLGNHVDPSHFVVVNQFLIDSIESVIIGQNSLISLKSAELTGFLMQPFTAYNYFNYSVNFSAANTIGVNVPCSPFLYGSVKEILTSILATIATDGSGNPATLDYYLSPVFDPANYNCPYLNGLTTPHPLQPDLLQVAFAIMLVFYITPFDIINQLNSSPPLTPQQLIDYAPFFNMLTIGFLKFNQTLLNNSFNASKTAHDFVRFLVYEVFLNFIPSLSDSGIGLYNLVNAFDFKVYLEKKIIETDAKLIPLLVAKAKVNDVLQRDPENLECAKFAWIRRLGHYMLKEFILEIGGVRMDQQFGDWLNIWYELTRNLGNDRGYNIMIGDTPDMYTFDNSIKESKTLYIPLPFWFCRMDGSYLPLTAMQYQDIIVRVKLETLANLTITEDNTYYNQITERLSTDGNGNTIVQQFNNAIVPSPEIGMFGTYIYLEKEERLRICGTRHEYLAEYVQDLQPVTIDSGNIPNNNIQILQPQFENCCKYFVWYAQFDRNIINKRPNIYTYDTSEETYTNYLNKFIKARKKFEIPLNPCLLRQQQQQQTEPCNPNDDIFWSDIINYNQLDDGCSGKNTINSATIKFNAQKRFDPRDATYFNYIQPWQYFSNTPQCGIQVYSFGVWPENFIPSGAFNASRINSIQLFAEIPKELIDIIKLSNRKLTFRMFAMSMNILRIFSGMASYAFL